MNDEDEVEASKAPLIDHLIELRARLIKSLIAFFLMLSSSALRSRSPSIICLLWPYEFAAGPDAPITLIFTAPQEFLFTQIKLGLFGAAFLSFPVVATQLYMFVAPGLYKHERGAFLPYLIATPFCFSDGGGLRLFRRAGRWRCASSSACSRQAAPGRRRFRCCRASRNICR